MGPPELNMKTGWSMKGVWVVIVIVTVFGVVIVPAMAVAEVVTGNVSVPASG